MTRFCSARIFSRSAIQASRDMPSATANLQAIELGIVAGKKATAFASAPAGTMAKSAPVAAT
jgi:hypothetical protein